jgi:CDP-diacylglycerol--serine O-phosphatidyltransferase
MAILLAHEGFLSKVPYLIFAAALFDFLDGFFAVKLKATSAIGEQLDSLADLISFGLAPAFLVYTLYQTSTPFHHGNLNLALSFSGIFPLLASAFRLARFNTDQDESVDFKGLPTPANGIFLVSVPLLLEAFKANEANLFMKFFLPAYIVLSSLLMVSKISMISLKFKNYRFSENRTRYMFLILCTIFFVFFQWKGLPIIILLYIFTSFALAIIKRH